MTFARPSQMTAARSRHLLTALAFWLCWVTMAAAHASLTGTVPADGSVVEAGPARFTLSFSEPVSPISLRLVRPDGSAVSLDKFTLRDRTLEIEAPPGLANGTHVISWRVVSEDGHPVGGSVIFSIGAPSGAPPLVRDAAGWWVRATLWLAKVGLYAGLFVGIGGAFAFNWFMRGSRPGGRVIYAMLGIGLVATVVSAGLQGLDALGAPLGQFSDARVWTAGLTTSFGRTVGVMLLAILLAFVALARDEPSAQWASVIALLAGATSLALSGHASAAEPQWLMRTSVFVHAAGIAIWIGALAPLGIALRASDPAALNGLRRFSRFIPFAVVALVVAGVVLAVVQVGRPAALVDTAYGNVLLVKLALLVVLFALAAVNRWILTKPSGRGEARALRGMVRSIAAETMVVFLILGVAATWRFTPPPRPLIAAAAEPVSTHLHSDKAMAEITVTPGRAGPVEIAAFVMKGDFDPLDAKEVTFVLSNAAAGIEPIKRVARKGADGTWRAENVPLPIPGRWSIRVDVLISDFELVRASGEIELAN
ncbi:UNVERIFIED_ORG: copper transport protein [Rhizobium esperanzae]